MRIDPGSLDQLLHPTIDPKAERKIVAHRSAGFARRGVGRDRVHVRGSRGAEGEGPRRSFWCASRPARKTFTACMPRKAFSPTRGGMTSHAAVVARGMGKPCVSGAGSIRIDYNAGTLTVAGNAPEAGRHHHDRRLDRPGAARPGAR